MADGVNLARNVVGLTKELLEVVELIERKIQQYSGLTATLFVKDLMEDMNFQFDSKGLQYNFLIFNLAQKYMKSNFINQVSYTSKDVGGTKFAIFIFESGTFENLGQGTHANWGMGGYKGGNRKASGPTVIGGEMGRKVEFFKP